MFGDPYSRALSNLPNGRLWWIRVPTLKPDVNLMQYQSATSDFYLVERRVAFP